MFRDFHQRSAVIRALLHSLLLDHLWSEHGPTNAARAFLRAESAGLSPGQTTMLRVALDLWDEGGRAELSHVVAHFDARRLELLGSLLIAFASGSIGVDYWLRKYLPMGARVRPRLRIVADRVRKEET